MKEKLNIYEKSLMTFGEGFCVCLRQLNGAQTVSFVLSVLFMYKCGAELKKKRKRFLGKASALRLPLICCERFMWQCEKD